MASLEVNLTFHINLEEDISWEDVDCYVEYDSGLMVLIIKKEGLELGIPLTNFVDLSIYEFNNRGTKDFLYEP
jgi:hypothetical protein